MVSSRKKILFVVNIPEFFVSHRLPLAVAAKKMGYEVHIASAEGGGIDQFKAEGFYHHVIRFARSGQNPLDEFKTLISLVKLFRRINPKLVHLITIKPVLYGGLAARLSRVKGVVSAISGLGTVFLEQSLFGRFRQSLICKFYAASLQHKKLAVIFQNLDDRDTLLAIGALSQQNTHIIRGSGVSLKEYPFLLEPNDRTVVVMAARLLRDKGVFEFVEAARELSRRGVGVRMRLIGSTDPGNISSVTQAELDEWQMERVVELTGYRSDIAEQYALANIVCLPSYREGLPKSLVEAAACGRAVVTTDVPGCRDAITPGKTGLLVPVKDSIALADAIQTLVEQPELRKEMGAAGRALAEKEFSIETIVEQHMQIYDEVLNEF